jgi:hypothetical protein
MPLKARQNFFSNQHFVNSKEDTPQKTAKGSAADITQQYRRKTKK